MRERDVVTWTTMITGYVKCGLLAEARRLFDRADVMKNVVTWTAMVSGYVIRNRIFEAKKLFEAMPVRNVVSWNTMVEGYAQRLAKNGRVDEAREVFERMPERNVVSWNAMVTGYAKNKRLDEAFDLFKRMPERDLPSWNTMITGFIQNGELGNAMRGDSEAALKIFTEMIRDGQVKPNEGTFVNVLGACSDLAGLGEGQQIHQMISKTVYQDMTFVVSALINMYSKCGELGSARKMFDDGATHQRDLVSWNWFKPDGVTYVGLLSACSHAGLVEDGLSYFDELLEDRSIQVRDDHYTCLVDLCAGCNVYGDLKVGKLAAEELVKEEPENAGTYLLLSNIYASSGKWGEAARVRLKMKEKGLKKQPGCSWIEIGNRVHVFLARDKSHCQSNLIYSLLHDLNAEIKKAWYVANSDFIVDEEF
ncbi:hypothetical protein GH714_036654 [Hevea brasiliensis]|uniref:Pentatricopeptide repeat-containing protein n=1 Tax=Hevea brasiliensis TaxID=3981 RepID=A0A6A6M4F7_HEVBR|nr:hypothetical protein GH714_036654 [Hevea brasiliensis]